MKRFGFVVLFSLLLVSFVVSFVSAQEVLQPIAEGAKSFYDNIFEPFGKFLLGQNTDGGELFFGKLLFVILLITIIGLTLNTFPPTQGKKGFLISFVVSILAVRYITYDWLTTIILPYTALGITLTALLPFVLFFFMVEKNLVGQPTLRKICWIFASIVFAGLFIYRNAAVTTTTISLFGFSSSTTPGFNPSYIYLIAAVACILVLLFDKTIQRAFTKARYDNINEIRKIKVEADLVEEYNKVKRQESEGSLPEARARTLINNIRARAKANGIEEGIFPLPYSR